MTEIIDEKMAAKRDLREMELRLKYELTVRMGVMLSAGVAFLAALITFVK